MSSNTVMLTLILLGATCLTVTSSRSAPVPAILASASEGSAAKLQTSITSIDKAALEEQHLDQRLQSLTKNISESIPKSSEVIQGSAEKERHLDQHLQSLTGKKVGAADGGAEALPPASVRPNQSKAGASDGGAEALPPASARPEQNKEPSLVDHTVFVHHSLPGHLALHGPLEYVTDVVHLVRGLTLVGFIKVVCVVGNVVMQISPLPQVLQWKAKGDTASADAAPYVSLAFNGWQWCFYGIFAYIVTGRTGFLILLQSNGLGALLGTYYTLVFFRTCKRQQFIDSLYKYLSAASALILFEMSAISMLPIERALHVVGIVAAVCGFIGAAAVFVIVPDVIKKKNAGPIAGPLVTANMVSAFAWSICGVILQDEMIAAPSMVSFIVCSTCVYLKFTYPSIEDDSDLCGVHEQGPLIKALQQGHYKRRSHTRWGKLGNEGDVALAKGAFKLKELSIARGDPEESQDSDTAVLTPRLAHTVPNWDKDS